KGRLADGNIEADSEPAAAVRAEGEPVTEPAQATNGPRLVAVADVPVAAPATPAAPAATASPTPSTRPAPAPFPESLRRPAGSDLEVAQLAAAFGRFGVEARHLKIWKQVADRETAFFEQVVTPLLKQRNPQARRKAGEALAELGALAGRLHDALLDAALDAHR